MTKYISLLRGINVGGTRKIMMSNLRNIYVSLGFLNVTTYIQSGNVIFDVNQIENRHDLEKNIQQAIFDTTGFDVPVVIRKMEELENVLSDNPFLHDVGTAIKQLYITFLKEIPTADRIEKISAFGFAPDKFKIIGNTVFINYSGKCNESKLTNQLIETKLKVSATTRNWKTVSKLVEMARLDKPPRSRAIEV